MPLATVIAGPYTGTYATVAVGKTLEGFSVRLSYLKEAVRTDYYGDALIDSVRRGSEGFLTFNSIEYSSGIAVITDYGGLGVMVQAGTLDVGSSQIDSVVLTAVAGTTAASTPASLTSSHAAPDADVNPELLYAARVRNVPLTLRLYPYDVTGTIRFFTTT